MDEATDTIVITGTRSGQCNVQEFIELFSDVGQIKTDVLTGVRMADTRIGRDAIPEAIITYDSTKAAENAISRFNGMNVNGQTVRVHPAQVYFLQRLGKGQYGGRKCYDNSFGYHWFNWVRSNRGTGGKGGKGGMFAQDGQDGEGYGFAFYDEKTQRDRQSGRGGNGRFGGGGGGGAGEYGRGGDGGNGCSIS